MGSQTGETPYSVADVARFTGWSTQTVIRTFEHERGVIIHESTRRPGARAYRTIRIPRHVYRRVVGQRTVK
jgi:hypothetical protein